MGNPVISEDRHLDIAIDAKSKSSVDNLKYSPNLHTEKIHKIVQQQYEVTFVQPSVANASNGGHIQTGNIKVLYQLRNGKLIVIGPHWVYSLIMLVVIITVGISFVVKACNDVGSWKHGIGGFVCTVATVGNFVICVLQDPGIVRPHQTLKNNKLNKYTVNSNALNNDRENGNVRHAFIDKLELTNQQSSLKYCEEKTENSEKLNNKEQIKNSYIQMIPMSASSSIDTLISSVPKPSQQLHSLYGIVTAGNMDKNLKRVRANNNKSRKKGKQTIHQDSKMPIGKTQVSSDLCPICQINCSTDTIHCSDCGVCIMGCDHHCPWTSKCVGKNNQTTFYSWIIVSTISALYMTIVMGIIHTTENSVLVLGSNYTQA